MSENPNENGRPTPVTPESHGPWALVVGGSEGVGRELVRLLAGTGFGVVAVARGRETLAETAAIARDLGAEIRTVAADLTSPEGIDAVVDAVADLDLGLVVLNAGANAYRSTFADGDLDRLRSVVDLNVTAPLALLHRIAPRLRDRGRGGIVTLGSTAGYLGHEDMALYSAAKAFVRVFTEGLWLEMRDFGVDVVHVVLGVTRTPAMERAGLDFDIPGLPVSEPADVAREILDALGEGPVVVLGGEGNRRQVEFASGTDRHKIVAGSAARMRALVGPA